jgi:hypothetical protein
VLVASWLIFYWLPFCLWSASHYHVFFSVACAIGYLHLNPSPWHNSAAYLHMLFWNPSWEIPSVTKSASDPGFIVTGYVQTLPRYYLIGFLVPLLSYRVYLLYFLNGVMCWLWLPKGISTQNPKMKTYLEWWSWLIQLRISSWYQSCIRSKSNSYDHKRRGHERYSE